MESSKDRTIRIGVIGTGQRGQQHLESYQDIPGAEIVAVADIDEPLVQEFAEKFKIPHAYNNYPELLQRDDIEAVDICHHNNLHRPATVAAMEARKDVY